MIQVSICIPVYNTEQYLERCIESAIKAAQGLSYEIIVVNDGSPGNCDEIVHSLNVEYIKHDTNKGLLEARRTAVTNALGEYVICLDSDDVFLQGSLKKLYDVAVKEKCDIVQGTGYVSYNDRAVTKGRKNSRYSFVNMLQTKKLTGKELFNGWLLKPNFVSVYMCNKLIKKDVYLSALKSIPELFCTLAEDTLQCFFIFQACESYIGVNIPIVVYSIDTGVTMPKQITDIQKWKHICSSVDISDIMLKYAESHNMDQKIINKLTRNKQGDRVRIKNWLKAVDESILDEAKVILQEYLDK